MRFDSHIETLLAAAVALVNGVTPGHDGTRSVEEPAGGELATVVSGALLSQGRHSQVTGAEAAALTTYAADVRAVFTSSAAGDVDRAAGLVNDLLRRTGARPQLDRGRRMAGGCTSTAPTTASSSAGPPASRPRSPSAWAATWPACSASARPSRATGSSSTSSKNGTRRFCSTRCQNRVKAAAQPPAPASLRTLPREDHRPPQRDPDARPARFTVRYGEDLAVRRHGPALARSAAASPTRHGRVTVHEYGGSKGTAGPAYVHFHGGAWLMRYPQMDDWWCRYVAATAGVRVRQRRLPHRAVRRLPGGAAPVPRRRRGDRCRGARRWSAASPAAAASPRRSACRRATSARSRRALQVLGVPALDLACDLPDRRRDDLAVAARAGAPRLLPRPRHPRPSPTPHRVLAPDLTGLPPAVVLTAERDTLRRDGDALRRAAARGRRRRRARRDPGRRPLLPHRGPACAPAPRWR